MNFFLQSKINAAGVWFRRVFVFCLVLFLCHRLTAFSIISAEFADLDALHLAQSFLVGAASDLWVATLIAMMWAIPAALCSPRAATWIAAAGCLALSTLFVLHQSYVEFYRVPIMAFHLHYLGDLEFIKASTSTNVWSPLVTANIAGALLAVLASTLRIKPAIPVLIITAIAGHALQIRYRVQWFIPGPLHFNPIEKIVVDLSHQTLIPPPTTGEVARFAQMRLAIAPESPRTRLRQKLHAAFQNQIAKGKRPVIAVLALETFRPTEIGVFRKESQPSAASTLTQTLPQTLTQTLTPAFDALSKNGLLFTEAWSSGTVTCAGQEALWCGQPSGLFSSLMRGSARIQNASCIPDEVKANGGLSIWVHNGDGKFDNQVSFWRRHGVSSPISSTDYPAEIPRGSWGLSDLILADRAVTEIAGARNQPLGNKIDFIAPFILTVSNHIPWDLPDDASDAVKKIEAPENQRGTQNTKMWRTTAYTDQAIARFVAGAKAQDFWRNTILIIASDHGNLEPGKHGTTTKGVNSGSDTGSDSAARRQSHIALLLTGGLVESALSELNPKNTPDFMTVHEPVGQTGVAELIRAITAKVLPRNPDILAWPPNWPVFSDQNETLYVPASDLNIKKSEFTRDWSLSGAVLNDAVIAFKAMTAP